MATSRKARKLNRILIQENEKLNIPNILINVINKKTLPTKSIKIYYFLLRELLKSNIEQQEVISNTNGVEVINTKPALKTKTIKTTVSHLVKEIKSNSRTDIRDSLEEIRNHTFVFNHRLDDIAKENDLDVIDLLKGIREQTIVFNQTKENNRKNTVYTGLITEFSIDTVNQESLVITFSESLTNELIKYYESNNTKLNLTEINDLKISHSINLYGLFKSKICNYSVQYQNYTENQLRDILGLHKEYSDIKHFNQLVIKKAINEINSKMSLNVELLKIEKPNKSNDLTERIYKFKITQTFTKLINKFNLKDFVLTIPCLVEYKYKNHTYVLQSDDLELDRTKNFEKLWVHSKSNKPCKKEVAFDIWENIYSEFKEKGLDFLIELGSTEEDFTSFLNKF